MTFSTALRLASTTVRQIKTRRRGDGALHDLEGCALGAAEIMAGLSGNSHECAEQMWPILGLSVDCTYMDLGYAVQNLNDQGRTFSQIADFVEVYEKIHPELAEAQPVPRCPLPYQTGR